MSKLIAYGLMDIPNQGPNEITELVKNFESDVSFDDLQLKINAYLLLLKSPVIVNRVSIRDIRFQVLETAPPMPVIIYYAQLHFVLVGDGDDSASI